MNATARNGDVWTSEKQDGFYLYRDASGNLYESAEAPAYRIHMDNACIGPRGIQPKTLTDNKAADCNQPNQKQKAE